MVNMNINTMIDTTKQRITISYRVALFLLAIVVVLMAFLTRSFDKDQINDTAIVAAASKQAVLAQRIAWLVTELEDPTNAQHGETLQTLRNAVKEIEQHHESLLADIGSNYLPFDAEMYRKLYYAPPLLLDAQMREFLQHAHHILQLTPDQVTSKQADVVALNKQIRERLNDSLLAAVDIYQKEIIARFEMLYHIVLGLSLFGVLMLAVIALFVFKPAISFVEQAQKRLIELNQLKGDFLANMSHEIRTPMNGIFGMTELLLDSSLNTRQQHYVRTLQNSADHLLGLINDILDFSKLEAGQMKLDPLRFNLLTTIEDVLDLIAPRAREKNLELLMRYVPGTPRFVVADPGRIRQVLFNLIGNAIKFTDVGYVMVHVELLSLEQMPDNRIWLSIRIEDTGIGIAEDKINRLFEKFMQVESGSTRARQGTGLGLAICRNLVTLMGGKIDVESVPRKGTIFTCHIPLEDASEPLTNISPQAALNGKRVLLVDDLAPNRLLYKESLSAAGVDCLIAENTEEALSMLAYTEASKQSIHAVITDYMMPGYDGVRLTKTIKSDPRFSTLPVIILSSAGEQGLIKRFDEAGANACLTKPTSRQQLFDTLANVITGAERGDTQSIITSEASTAMSARRLLTRERPLHGTHILLVEDNRVNLEITTEMLNQFGCEVTTAVNGHEAIKAARAHAFDLIFMDCQMPEMDGFEAASHIVSLKASGQIAPVPIVALTANALKGDRERCLESGMDDYLSKPMRKATLEAVLLKWLRSRLEENSMSSTVPITPMPIPDTVKTVQSPADYGLDAKAFEAARDMLGTKLPVILSYYLEDAEGYIERIADSLVQRDPVAAVAPAHTLKSSSRQLGVKTLADLAERVETIARTSAFEAMEELAMLVPDMQRALVQVRPFFQTIPA